MALITLTFEDDPNVPGLVLIRMDTDTPEDGTLTDAMMTARLALAAVSSAGTLEESVADTNNLPGGGTDV